MKSSKVANAGWLPTALVRGEAWVKAKLSPRSCALCRTQLTKGQNGLGSMLASCGGLCAAGVDAGSQNSPAEASG
jgi:hypothetical protein